MDVMQGKVERSLKRYDHLKERILDLEERLTEEEKMWKT